MKGLTDSTKDVIDKVEGLTGQGQADVRGLAKGAREVDRDRGRYVDPAIAKVLCRAAEKGGMTQIQMDDDKRWRWVSREIADRNDRSVPKEPG
jgi:hypothetical protein